MVLRSSSFLRTPRYSAKSGSKNLSAALGAFSAEPPFPNVAKSENSAAVLRGPLHERCTGSKPVCRPPPSEGFDQVDRLSAYLAAVR